MPQITFVSSNGDRRVVDIESGTSLMQGATRSGIDGIVAECGGNAMCATCHVYIEGDVPLPPMGDDEDALLAGAAAERRPTSRLSCQIPVTEAFEGLVVGLPDRQV